MNLRVGVFGAGAIGVHVGLRLAAAGAQVVMLGRESLVEAHRSGRLRWAAIGGPSRPSEDADAIEATTDPGRLADVDLVLLCVKSADTEAAAATLAAMPSLAAVPVVSLQNGLRNPARLRTAGLEALAGMVAFNVHRVDEAAGATYRQATSGAIMIEDAPRHAERLERLCALARRTDLAVELRSDMRAVTTGKLLLNLNNAICALAGVSIADSLRSRDLRRCFAASMREALAIYGAAGERPAQIGRLPPRLIARLLPLPDAIVLRVAKSMITIDPAARSSTLQDLERGRPTEIDALNGELVHLAERAGAPCPINRWIVAQIHRLEREQPREHFAPRELWAAIDGL